MAITQIADHQRIWIEALNRGDASVADQVFAHDCVIHLTGFADPIQGVDAWKQVVGVFLTAFPDLAFTTEEQVVVGDTVVTRWRGRGTQTGPFGLLPPTGRTISIDGLILDHLIDGRVAERWEQFDQAVMLQQLGV
jgi:steroid delta-isomerase-like uncharacterized protein